REALAEARRALAVAEAGIEAAAEREKTLLARSERLGGERARIEEQTLAAASGTARTEAAQQRRQVSDAEERVAQAESGVNTARAALRVAVQKLAEIGREQASVEGRLESLDRLARIAQGSEEAERWLGENGLRDARRLAAAIEIEPGWEWAVEVALGDWLEALEVGSLNDIAISLAGLDAGKLSLAARGEATSARAGTLAAKVRSPFPVVMEFLAGIHAADSRATLFAARETLGPGESVISRDGLWCGRDWLRVARRVEGDSAGVIEREREHARLLARREELQGEVTQAEHEQGAGEQTLAKTESDYANARELARSARDELAAALTREAEAGGREQGARERLAALGEELGELAEQIAAAGGEREHLRESLSRSRGDCERLESASDAIETALAEARAQAAGSRAAYEAAHQAREALALKLESSRLQAQAATETTRRLREERETLAVERGHLQGRLGEMDDPGAELQGQLETCLDNHREVNTELTAARDRCSAIETRVTELERARHGASARVAELREGLEGARLAAQQLKTRCEGLAEQLDELDADANEVLAAIEEGADADEWERRLEAVAGRIQRLGAINLTAIDECAAEAEREDYLKRQREDLAEAMQTLENAIRKIDRETRARFKETFDRINQRLGELFPRLFGGGTAALVLTGEELLDAGVLITAHPPGKKNATIQMLSGGEKALVAVALVFAIFELNPAPFCLLDEVDAPMDDANIARFCDLVRELSANTQFVLITHNRQTMTLCRQLIGVTMQEPGVSRLVGVDVDEAERLAVG
ncbi:MAG: chromosome segregation protein SMC, partial [Gammaproteobacteria bacterium]